MRAQISLEFMVYTAAGIASLLIVLAAAGPFMARIDTSSTSGYMSALVAEINANSAFSESTFSAYMPEELCNATINQNGITYKGVTYGFVANMAILSNLCGYAGHIGTLELDHAQNGTIALRVVN
ncbi:MAG: hypothetical protein M1360_04400 [Candidatus Marsarchaeota archaeon]|jgi:uncharacterized protein (UPF0333 family)|nr:hypothetical protein [Candidatus Marsarchaeota archaeon]MCL5419147.1 hypothetical protein [Candidatus Marsarchaeota archaeon]